MTRFKRHQTSHECPVPGCLGTRRFGDAVCFPCWRRLPEDHRGAIQSARRARARHREAQAAIAAVAWLVEHPTRVFEQGDS